ncbi:MAG: HAD hydrolase-like protein [Lachnospiraceae bacterium]|nr:HAD hydrolase-like protein [Lachnospiraceae bacterium]
MWNTILFDLDGTLTDSGEGIMKSAQYALQKTFQIEIADYQELRSFVGPPLVDSFLPYADGDKEKAEQAVTAYRERFKTIGIFENFVYPGIREILQKLSEAHYTLALTSSKPEIFCRQILEHFDLAQYFTEVCGAELDGTRSKKPELIEETLRRLGMSDRREEAVMVGDRLFDMNGAKETGIASIGVSWGYGERSELEACWPDCIVDAPQELYNVLYWQAHEQQSETGREAELKNEDGSVIFRIWRVIYPLLIDLALSFIVSFLLMNLLIRLHPQISGEVIRDQNLVLVTGVIDALLFGICYFLLIRDETKRRAGNAWSRIPLKKEMRPETIGKCMGFGMTVGFSLSVVIGMLQIADPTYEATAEMFAAPNILMQIAVLGLIGPAAEEVVFRGLIYRRIRDYLGVFWAAVLSAAVFGIVHGNLTQGIFAFLLGILLAMLYEHYGSLKACMAAHMANNLFSVLLSAVSDKVSGIFLVMILFAYFIIAVTLAISIFVKEEKINRI